jgi:uncharacterized protein (TIGR02677 family)
MIWRWVGSGDGVEQAGRVAHELNYNVFAHLTAEKAALYRAVLGVFARAKGRFVIHLRPGDVGEGLEEALGERMDDTQVEAMLQQLTGWGNLNSHPDTSEVMTVKDFWLVRSLYQMSAAGEAAEAALDLFEKTIQQPGELQAAALSDIKAQLERVKALAEEDEPDAVEVFNTLSLLRQRFEGLTAQAQRFIGTLQRRVELQGLNVESFVAYKQRLIKYLDEFLNQLAMTGQEVAAVILSMNTQGVERVLRIVAERELVDRLVMVDEERAQVLSEAVLTWRRRWQGLSHWFVGSPGRPSQAQELRSAARAAIPSLVAAVTGINDRRAGRSDRAADLRSLALWFAQAPDDGACHRLWRAGFGLNSCRHLSVDEETLLEREGKPVAASTRWVEAPALKISPRLVSHGKYVARAKPFNVIDRSAEKAELERLASQEAWQIERWRRELATGRKVRLSEMRELESGAFDLFLDLLGDALSAKTGPGKRVSTVSSDGTLRLDLEPTGDGKTAVIRTSGGTLSGEDHFILIRSLVGEEAAETRAADEAGIA